MAETIRVQSVFLVVETVLPLLRQGCTTGRGGLAHPAEIVVHRSANRDLNSVAVLGKSDQ